MLSCGAACGSGGSVPGWLPGYLARARGLCPAGHHGYHRSFPGPKLDLGGPFPSHRHHGPGRHHEVGPRAVGAGGTLGDRSRSTPRDGGCCLAPGATGCGPQGDVSKVPINCANLERNVPLAVRHGAAVSRLACLPSSRFDSPLFLLTFTCRSVFLDSVRVWPPPRSEVSQTPQPKRCTSVPAEV